MSECLAIDAVSICTSIVEYSIFSNRIFPQLTRADAAARWMRFGLVPDRSWRAFDGKFPGSRRASVSAVFAVRGICRRRRTISMSRDEPGRRGAAARATSFVSAASSAAPARPGFGARALPAARSLRSPRSTGVAAFLGARSNCRSTMPAVRSTRSWIVPNRPSLSTKSISSSGCTPARSASRCATSSPATGSLTFTRPSMRAASGRRVSSRSARRRVFKAGRRSTGLPRPRRLRAGT